MKTIGIAGTAILSLLLGIGAPAYAQHEKQSEDKDHPKQQQSKEKQGKPQQQHAQQQAPSNPRKEQPQRAQQTQRQAPRRQQAQAQQQRGREQPQRAQSQQRVRQSTWQQHRARSWQSDHRTWQQRGGYHGYRVPDVRFRQYFGPDHGFRIYGLPFVVVSGFPRFQYRGYWFSLVDPWPEYWANDWYDTDDVYVNYVDNGYYLFNRRHPDVGIAIRVSL
jgi:hypothetical protein